MELKCFCLRLKGLNLPTFTTRRSSYEIIYDAGGNLVMTKHAEEFKAQPVHPIAHTVPPIHPKNAYQGLGGGFRILCLLPSVATTYIPLFRVVTLKKCSKFASKNIKTCWTRINRVPV